MRWFMLWDRLAGVKGRVGRGFGGWTLLELLIVMSIITILMAMFVPACWNLIKYVRHLTGKD